MLAILKVTSSGFVKNETQREGNGLQDSDKRCADYGGDVDRRAHGTCVDAEWSTGNSMQRYVSSTSYAQCCHAMEIFSVIKLNILC